MCTHTVRSFGTRYFFLSMVSMSDLSFFSQMTGMRSLYFWRRGRACVSAVVLSGRPSVAWQ